MVRRQALLKIFQQGSELEQTCTPSRYAQYRTPILPIQELYLRLSVRPKNNLALNLAHILNNLESYPDLQLDHQH